MAQRYVLDTNGLIAYFDQIFPATKRLSTKVLSLISEALYSRNTQVRLTIPSVVFVEVFEKWLTTEEKLRQFYYEAFVAVEDSPNIEVRAIEQEILEALVGVQLDNHEIHDKIILASAIVVNGQLITSDSVISSYIAAKGLPPAIW